MKQALYILFYLVVLGPANGQVNKAPALSPQKIRGGVLFKKNISFGSYQTKHMHRTIGSFFSGRAIIPGNLLKVEGVPIYHKEKRRSKDHFHFDLNDEGQKIAYVDVQATMLQNETFHLFRKQDSTFFGKANTDVLMASVQPDIDTATWWQLEAYNLNASKDEPQRGTIRQSDKQISFEKKTILLRDHPNANTLDTLFSSLYMAYEFRYKGEIIAAVAYKDNDRLCWIIPTLEPSIKNAVAATIAILRLRRTIYK
jgi:hypothetical protein